MKTKKIHLSIFMLLLSMSLVIPYFSSEKIWMQNLNSIMSPPGAQYWFGTDSLGRDQWARVWSAVRLSIFLGFGVMSIVFAAGLIMGGVISMAPQKVQMVLMRLSEVTLSIPQFILISFLIVSLKAGNFEISSVALIIIGMSLTAWIPLARLTRNQVFIERDRLYVEAARSIGASRIRIFFKHLLPNIFPVLISWVCLQLTQLLLLESSLSFLGLGVEPPNASLGVLMNEGWKNFLFAPHLLLIPSGILWILIYSLNGMFTKNSERSF